MQRKKNRRDYEFDKNICAFCGEPSDEKKFGKFFTSKFGFSVHQYCMFFSAALPQNGEDEEGFEGFLEQDVLKEIRRASRLKCCMCGKKGASAGCCDQHCRKGFHFPCGVEKKYLFQFFGQFRAYCFDHRLHQNTTSYPPKEAQCPICLEPVQCQSSPDILTTPCCKDVWFHRSCVQQQAVVSGYFFRCSVCNDTEKFVEEMKRMGVYVPDRDAAWEDGNNFAELLEKYNHCDHSECWCPMGRQHSTDTGTWEMILCSSCGQFGTHVGCTKWASNPPFLLCPACLPAHENSQPTTRFAEAVKFNQGGTVKKSSTGAAGATKFNQVGTVAKSVTNIRKGRVRPRKKLQHVDSDTDSDDISNVLNGLKRQAEGNFLNSDTSFRVQRALAAGDAAMQHGGTKEFRDSQSAALIPSGCNSNRKRKADDPESDDEIMITKYVPGQKPRCEICPKCNRRKPITTGTPAKIPRKSFPLPGTSSSVGKNSGSTCTVTKADMENKVVPNVTFEYKRGTLVTETGQLDSAARNVTVADYEVLELAAEHTDKSSVLLLSSERRKNGMVESLKDGNTNKDNDKHSGSGRQKEPPSKSTSWLASSVEKMIHFLNPLSTTKTNEQNSRRLSERSRQVGEDIRRLTSSTNSNAVFNKEVSNSTCGSLASRDTEKSDEEIDVTIWLNSSEEKSGSTEGRSALVGRRSDTIENRSRTIGNGSESIATTPETNSKQTIHYNANSSKFSGSLPNSRKEFLTKKAVLEAVIDHAKELKNSGKELKHRCVSSC